MQNIVLHAEDYMSSTRLIQFRNGIADDCMEYRNSWGGASRIWDSIWSKYGTPKHEYDNWLTAATDGRLWKLWETEEFSESEKLVYLFTCDNALVAKEDFAKLAIALRDFAAKYPPKGVCHLGAWADFLEASTAEAIGLHATTVTENPWFGWDEEKDESEPYDITKGDKHWWIGDRIKESAEAV